MNIIFVSTRATFNYCVILCIWHICQAWLKNVLKYASKDRVKSMFEWLEMIMNSMGENKDTTYKLLNNFFIKFSDQLDFLVYF